MYFTNTNHFKLCTNNLPCKYNNNFYIKNMIDKIKNTTDKKIGQ